MVENAIIELNRSLSRVFPLVLVAATLLGSHANAKTIRPTRHYTMDDGLSQAQVTSLLEDSRGFIWAGTVAGGINRIDGSNIKNDLYNKQLGGAWIKALAEFNGRIFVGTEAGLFSIDHKGRVIEHSSHPYEYIALQAVDDKLYYLTYQKHGHLLGYYKKSNFHPIPTNLPKSALATELAVTADHRIWIGTRNSGIYYVHEDKTTRVENIKCNNVHHIISAQDSRLYAACGLDGVYKINEDQAEQQIFAKPDTAVYSTYIDQEFNIYAGTDSKGFYVKRTNGQIEHYDTNSSIPDRIITGFLEDTLGNLWIGFNGEGVMAFPRSSFINFSKKDNINVTYTFQALSNDRVFMGGKLGASFFNRETITFEHPFLENPTEDTIGSVSHIYSSYIQPKGNQLLLGTRTGLYSSNTFFPYEVFQVDLPTLHGTNNYPIYKIVRHADGVLLNSRFGLIFYDGRQAVAYNEKLGFEREEHFTDITVSDNGNLYMISWDHRFWVYDKSQSKRIEVPIPKNVLQSARRIHGDQFGTIWLGSKFGVARYDTTRKRFIKINLESINNLTHVFFIQSGADGLTWIGTNRGIIVVKSNRMVRHFSRLDGLLVEETNANAVMLDQTGSMWFGMDDSVSWLPSVRITPTPTAPPTVYIEKVNVFEQPLTLESNTIQLTHEQNQIGFSYVSPHPASLEVIRYRYMLEGFDTKWSETIDTNLRYTNLPPGEYNFQIKAVNRFGIQSDTPASLAITIEPPFWHSMLFKSLAVFAVLLLVLSYIHLAVRKARLKSSFFEQLATERDDQIRKHTQEISALKQRFGKVITLDELTGIYNRQFFFDRLGEEASRAKRKSSLVGILLVDIDRLREINDTYDFESGDTVLRTIARELNAKKRPSDILGRFGGEEFAIACELTKHEDLDTVAERIRNAVQELDIPLKDSIVVRRTVSIGGASYTPRDREVKMAVERAEYRLFEAKKSGNSIVIGPLK